MDKPTHISHLILALSPHKVEDGEAVVKQQVLQEHLWLLRG